MWPGRSSSMPSTVLIRAIKTCMSGPCVNKSTAYLPAEGPDLSRENCMGNLVNGPARKKPGAYLSISTSLSLTLSKVGAFIGPDEPTRFIEARRLVNFHYPTSLRVNHGDIGLLSQARDRFVTANLITWWRVLFHSVIA